MPEPTDPAYWEGWARDLGWGQTKVREAGILGSRAVLQGMTTPEAVEVVLAVVRDGRSGPTRPVGQSPMDRLVRTKGSQCAAVGVLAMAIALSRLTINPDLPIFPVAYGVLIVWGLALFVRDIGRSSWRLPALGAGLSLGSLALWLVPIHS